MNSYKNDDNGEEKEQDYFNEGEDSSLITSPLLNEHNNNSNNNKKNKEGIEESSSCGNGKINRKQTLISLFWVVIYIALNMTLFFLNKYLDTSKPVFQFPIFVITTGTFATFIGSCIAVFVFKLSEFPYEELMKNKRLLLICSVLQALSYVLENVSIVNMSIPLNQVIKATGPAFIIFFSWLIYRVKFPFYVLSTTFIIVIGVCITIFTSLSTPVIGFIQCLGSIVTAAIQTVLIAVLIKNPKLNSLSLLVATTLPSAFVCLGIFFIFEFKKLQEYSGPTEIPIIAVVALAVSALFYNIAHFYIVQYTSALYYVIVGNLKVILIVVISSLLFSNGFTSLNYVGSSITLIGFIMFNVLKYYEKIGVEPPFLVPFYKFFNKITCCKSNVKANDNNNNNNNSSTTVTICAKDDDNNTIN